MTGLGAGSCAIDGKVGGLLKVLANEIADSKIAVGRTHGVGPATGWVAGV